MLTLSIHNKYNIFIGLFFIYIYVGTYFSGNATRKNQGLKHTLEIPTTTGRLTLAATDRLYHGSTAWRGGYRFICGLYLDARLLRFCIWNKLCPINYQLDGTFVPSALKELTKEHPIEYREEEEYERLLARKEELYQRLLRE